LVTSRSTAKTASVSVAVLLVLFPSLVDVLTLTTFANDEIEDNDEAAFTTRSKEIVPPTASEDGYTHEYVLPEIPGVMPDVSDIYDKFAGITS
jgi:hypothetical protein